eukprot:COSAG05_NODE_240_length_13119_cov_122.275806_3_plen_142_part_00
MPGRRYYESARAESMDNGCPGAKVTTGWCVLDNLLTESNLGVAAGVHTYLQHVNRTDPTSPVESQLPHIAAFMLAQAENWCRDFYAASCPTHARWPAELVLPMLTLLPFLGTISAQRVGGTTTFGGSHCSIRPRLAASPRR